MNNKTPLKLRDKNDIKPKKLENDNIIKITKSDNSPTFLTGLLTVLLIATYIAVPKSFEPKMNIYVSASLFVYPLTFLILTIMCRKYTFKEIRKSIYTSSLLYIIFFIIMSICISISGGDSTSNYNLVIQFIFAGKVKFISGRTIFYPVLTQTLGVVIAYFISHLIYSSLYFILKDITTDHISVVLGLFIAYIIDRTIFVPIYYLKFIFGEKEYFYHFVKCITSEYIFSIIAMTIIVIIYFLTGLLKKEKSKQIV